MVACVKRQFRWYNPKPLLTLCTSLYKRYGSVEGGEVVLVNQRFRLEQRKLELRGRHPKEVLVQGALLEAACEATCGFREYCFQATGVCRRRQWKPYPDEIEDLLSFFREGGVEAEVVRSSRKGDLITAQIRLSW